MSEINWSFEPYPGGGVRVRCEYAGKVGLGDIPIVPGRPDLTQDRAWIDGDQRDWPVSAWMAYRECLGGFLDTSGLQIQGFLKGNLGEICSQLKTKWAQGMRIFKLKVGQDPLEDAKRINQVMLFLPVGGLLRLDANQSWTLAQAIQFWGALENSAQIEYIEEPLQKSGLLSKFCVQTGANVALDETLFSPQFQWILNFKGWEAVVMKPSLMRIGQMMSILHTAKLAGVRVIWSSAYETEVGLESLKRLAVEYSPGESVGADTLFIY